MPVPPSVATYKPPRTITYTTVTELTLDPREVEEALLRAVREKFGIDLPGAAFYTKAPEGQTAAYIGAVTVRSTQISTKLV